jgi:hypothetical protein
LGSPDFLRQVVSKVLNPSQIDSKKLEEIRRLLAKAETKYSFSTYGGDPRRLADYLASPDFIELILVLGSETTKKLLYKIIEAYDNEKIKEVANKILNEIEGYGKPEELRISF